MKILNYLLPKFSLLSKIGNASNISNDYYNFDFPKTIQEAWARDARAIKSDWDKVGVDLQNSMNRYKSEHPKAKALSS